jgi:hypothetical protein
LRFSPKSSGLNFLSQIELLPQTQIDFAAAARCHSEPRLCHPERSGGTLCFSPEDKHKKIKPSQSGLCFLVLSSSAFFGSARDLH